MPSKLFREEDGSLPAYAWPGGYPIVYLCDDGGELCPDCANGKNGSDASESPEADRQWRLIAGDVYWEGPPVPCDHCGRLMESAYGESA